MSGSSGTHAGDLSGDAGLARRPSVHEVLLANPNLVRTLSVLVFLAVWEIVGRQMDPIFMTYPSAVFRAGVAMIRSHELIVALWESLVPFAVGMTISIVLGIAIGVGMGLSRLFEYAVDPYLNAMNAIPRVALVPLITLWFGLGGPAKVVIIVSVAIFPVIINTFAGVHDVRGALLDVGRVYSATRAQILRKIIIPAALPFIMAGVRVSLGLGLIGMVVAEFFTSLGGLGGIIVNDGNLFKTAQMFVAITVIGVLGIGLTQAALRLERHWTHWRQSERDRG